MKEQKNIERLFQEKFKDFEVAPPEMVWKNIEEKLNEKKKKRRVIPFWFKGSGIAASLLLGFYIYNLSNESSLKIEEPINTSVEKNNENLINKANSSNSKITSPSITEENVLTENDNVINQTDYVDGINNVSNKKETFTKTSENLVALSKKDNTKNSNSKSVQPSMNINKENKDAIVLTDNNKSDVDKNKNRNNTSNLVQNEINFDKINAISNDKNRSVLVENSTKNTAQDSSLLAKISEEVNALEQLLKEKEVGKNVEEKEKEKRNRWAVSSNASPVYFNSSSKGSPIDSRFESNEKSYNNNLSYGLGVSYAINDKISFRTGVNTVNLDYNTKEVVFYQDANAREIENVSRNQRGSLIDIENKSVNNDNLAGEINLFGNSVKKYDGELNQQMGYIEVPLELAYKVLDKKIGIEFVGGMSTLFLNKNNVSIVSNGVEMEIGKANNLNKVHFSSNIGIGFKYKFLKSFEANFNPMFKYQLNTYTENSGNFKPYFIGLYSGFTFKF